MDRHTPTPWRNLNIFSVSVLKGTKGGDLASDEMRALACVNAFHSPDRSIPTEAIEEGVFWRMEKLHRVNLATMQEQRNRLVRYGKSTCELDTAIKETETLLSTLKVEQK